MLCLEFGFFALKKAQYVCCSSWALSQFKIAEFRVLFFLKTCLTCALFLFIVVLNSYSYLSDHEFKLNDSAL